MQHLPHFVFDMPFFLRFVFDPQPALLQGLVSTVLAAAVAQLLGTVLGALLGLAGMHRALVLRVFNQAYIWFFRGTPVLVQLVLIYFGLPYLVGFDLFPSVMAIGPVHFSGALLAGIIAFGLHEAAYMSEITRASVGSISPGQTEAALALGMTPALAMRRIVLPQAVPLIVPALGNQFNNMLKTTALLSVIGVSEMFRVAEQMQAATFMTFEVYLGVSVYYLILTGVWTFIQHGLEAWVSRGWANNKRRGAKAAKSPRPRAYG
ncbi:amino acid ABC transporter permease [Paraburkholderia sp. J41]|uniref:amino acid ABC transporter permease n=1 Tax=Paraburkholderia sp. J41 TaxID=2805433 RepID=UPI002AC36EFD|nr:amino acid ABC transporter permease [Paraburkholderia sp. J41]